MRKKIFFDEDFKSSEHFSSQRLCSGERVSCSSRQVRLTDRCCSLKDTAEVFNVRVLTYIANSLLLPVLLLITSFTFLYGNGLCRDYKCVRPCHRFGCLMLTAYIGGWDWNQCYFVWDLWWSYEVTVEQVYLRFLQLSSYCCLTCWYWSSTTLSHTFVGALSLKLK
jgi:hypothetical protein